MEHSYSLPEQSHPLPAPDEHAKSFSALNLALWLSFIGLFGSALAVSFMGNINVAFTMPIAALLFVSLVVVVFCFRHGVTTFHTFNIRETAGTAEPSDKPNTNNVVKLRPVQTRDGHISYKRA
jgi:hypothetical protein